MFKCKHGNREADYIDQHNRRDRPDLGCEALERAVGWWLWAGIAEDCFGRFAPGLRLRSRSHVTGVAPQLVLDFESCPAQESGASPLDRAERPTGLLSDQLASDHQAAALDLLARRDFRDR